MQVPFWGQASQETPGLFCLGKSLGLVQDVGKPGNPPVSGTGERGFNSHRPDFLRCGRMVRRLPVKETIAGSIPAAAATNGRASQQAMAAAPKTAER
jgi:hypothetical protein